MGNCAHCARSSRVVPFADDTPHSSNETSSPNTPHSSNETSSPNIKELLEALKNLGSNWHTMGIHLGVPKMKLDEIDRVHKSELNRCKADLFDIWIKITPNPSWTAIVEALEAIDERVLAKVVREEYVHGLSSQPESCAFTSSGSITTATSIVLSSRKISLVFDREDAVVQELRSVHLKYVNMKNDLATALQAEKLNLKSLKLFVDDSLEAGGEVYDLEVDDIFDLFCSLQQYCCFLNPEILHTVSQKFLSADSSVSMAFNEYMESLRKFKESTTVQQFKEAITNAVLEQQKPVESSFVASEAGVVLRVTNLYADLKLSNIDKLVKYIFAGNQKLLSNLDIKSGSILLSWQAPKATIIKLSRQIEERASLMQAIGIAPVKIGLKEYPDVSCTNYETFEAALLKAVIEDNTEAVKLLLDMGANSDATNTEGETALILASSLGLIKCVEYLLQWKADTNRCDGSQKTALFCACQNGHMRVAQILFASGSDIDLCVQDSKGHTALTVACMNNHTDIVEFLVCSCDMDYNRQSVSVNFLDTDRPKNPEFTGYGGWTGLMVASFHGNSEVVKLLIKLGANLNLQDQLGYTALIYASIGNHLETIELLLESGANVLIHDNRNWSAFAHALKRKHNKAGEILCSQQMDLNFDLDATSTSEDVCPDHSCNRLPFNMEGSLQATTAMGQQHSPELQHHTC